MRWHSGMRKRFLLLLFFFITAHSFAQNTVRWQVDSVSIVGNKTTKNHIVLREVVIHINDTLTAEDINRKVLQSKQNLMNTSLFNFVYTHVHYDSLKQTAVIGFTLKEAWYIFPIPVFASADRNINEWLQDPSLKRVSGGINFTQYNVRGRNETMVVGFTAGYSQSLSLGYSVPYLDKKQRSGISAGVGYARLHEVPIFTINNNVIVGV